MCYHRPVLPCLDPCLHPCIALSIERLCTCCPFWGLQWLALLPMLDVSSYCMSYHVLPWVSDVSHFRAWRWSCSWLFFWKCLDLWQNSSKMGPFRLILGGITHVFPRFFVKNEYLHDFLYFCLKSAVFGIF